MPESGSDGPAAGVDPPEDVVFALIAAVAADRTIGVDGRIPWDYPADLRHFRETTTGHPVVMGRRTYEGIVAGLGGPLPGRTSVVLTRGERSFPEGVVRVSSVSAAVELAAADARERGVDTAYVAGGATVYEQFLDRTLADRLVLTAVPGEYDGDARFPSFDPAAWHEVDRKPAGEDGELAFVTYERRH